MGFASVVILNDFASIKKFMCQKEILNRPFNWVMTQAKVDGELWNHFCTQNPFMSPPSSTWRREEGRKYFVVTT